MLKPEEARRPWTVSELARQIQVELAPLRAVFVKGEVIGMKRSVQGHYSFQVRDPGAVIDAFLFANDARRLAMLPEDGQEMIFRGRIDFWARGGRIRLIVDYVEFDDMGKLRAQLERLKQRLEAEGAFAPERKRPIPFLPRAVALITSPVGAVIHDLEQTILDRFPNMSVYRYPALVQGAMAPPSIAAAIRQASIDGLADVAVVARGGGSFEELYAFNTEVVARAILNSKMPVVTALGHTSDRTFADLVADAECRTPTEAGARIVPRKSDLVATLAERERRLERDLRRRFDAVTERLRRARADLSRLSPARQLERRLLELAERGRRLDRAGVDRLARSRRDLEARGQRLDALSPYAVLGRGYSITSDEESGSVLLSAAATRPGRRVRIRLARGSLTAGVEEAES